MALADDPTVQPNDPAVDPTTGLEQAHQLIEDFGNAASQNMKKSAAETGSAEDARNYAQAGLYAAEALTALLAYMNPTAPNAPGDNQALKGD